MTKQEFVDGMIWTDLITHENAILMLRLVAEQHDGLHEYFSKMENEAWEDYQELQSDILKS